MKKLFTLFTVLVVVVIAVITYRHMEGQPSTSFRTAPVKRGDLVVTISATGTVEPEEVVDVGAQVAGKIETFGMDPSGNGKPIDYGTAVDVGTILAQIDNSLYAADVASNTSQLEQAKANLLRSKADVDSKIASVDQASAGVDLANITYNHLKALMPEDSASAIEMQTAEATLKQAQAALETANANVAVSKATVRQTESAILQQEASLKRAQTNLDYCTIRSPVKGVIIDRRVNIGQTVVSSLNAPSLFLIAKDLKRMQVWASVNEADIGNIHPGQSAQFTVDAYPGRVFVGQVGKIRLNATMTQNVVTYTVEINTDNSDGKLLPYLTANVQFEVTNLKNVLMVPSVALRWTPSSNLIAPDARTTSSPAPGVKPAGSGSRKSNKRQDVVWVTSGEFVRPIPIRAGLSDGSQTQIEGDQIQEGLQIVSGEALKGDDSTSAGTTNPFTPQMFGGRRQ